METKKEKINPQWALICLNGNSCSITVKLDGFGEVSFKDFKPSDETMNRLRAEIILFTKKKIGEIE